MHWNKLARASSAADGSSFADDKFALWEALHDGRPGLPLEEARALHMITEPTFAGDESEIFKQRARENVIYCDHRVVSFQSGLEGTIFSSPIIHEN